MSPGSKSPSPRVSINNSHPDLERQSSSPVGESEHEDDDADDISPLMKETDQELLDEMIVKDVPESESSTDPVKKFEETLPSTNIESIKEEDSDTECKDLSYTNLDLATNIPQPSQPILSFTTPFENLGKENAETTKIIVKSPSSSETESEKEEKQVEEIVLKEEVEESPVILRRTKPSVEMDSSRPTSSDLSDTEFKKPSIQETISKFNERAEVRPTSSEYESDEKPKMSPYGTETAESTETDEKKSRPSSSDFSESNDNKPALKESSTEEEAKEFQSVRDRIQRFDSSSVTSLNKETFQQDEKPAIVTSSSSEAEKGAPNEETSESEDLKPMESVKDRISRYNSGSRTSLDMEPSPLPTRKNADSISLTTSDHEADRKEVVIEETSQTSESVKERISRLNSGSVTSLEREVRPPSSSDYEKEKSDLHRPASSSASSAAKFDTNEKIDLDLPVSSIKDKISKFHHDIATSQDSVESEKRSRPASSVYSDDFDFTKPEIQAPVEDEPMESIKERISRFNSGSVTSLDREGSYRVSSRPSSGYSDFGEKKALFEKQEDTSSSKVSLVSATSSESESFAKPPRQSSSEYSEEEKEEKIELESRHDDISEVTEHANTVREKSIADDDDEDSIESERKMSRPVSSDYSDIFDKNKVDEATQPQAQEDQKISQESGHKRSSSSSSEDQHGDEVNVPLRRHDTSSFEKKDSRPVSSDYSESSDKPKVGAQILESSFDEKEVSHKMSTSSRSSLAEEKNEASQLKREDTSSSEDQNEGKMMQHSSSDSSVSKQKSDQELTRQDAVEIEDKDKAPLRRKQSSSEYSESDVEGRKAVDSSSDYDSASNRGRKRPDSMISDTSSDYDSLSNVGSRRPQSFLLDDEYDVITEEGESEKHKNEEDASSSSESEGPDAKDAGKKVRRIPPPGVLKESSGEDEDQDGDEESTSIPSQIPIQPISSTVASSSLFQVSDMHVEQSSVSHTLDQSSVTVSGTLDQNVEIHSSNITKNMAELKEKRSYQETSETYRTTEVTTSASSSSSTKYDQAIIDGSSISGMSQGIYCLPE